MSDHKEFVWAPGKGNIPVSGDYKEIRVRIKRLEDSFQELHNWVRVIVNEGQVKPMSDLQRRVEEFRLFEE